ncbi:MAG: type II toxin-antitoxin system VapC family toxin [Lachnospiraceae bacterium]|nr:type II toxin-antitoxin system VapC family toxin [Lachnospiraceae bacterium]
MNYLLDTHILLWVLGEEDKDGQKLPDTVKTILLNPENTIFYSSINIFETELKRIVRPQENLPSGEELIAFCNDAGFELLRLENKHILAMKTLEKDESVINHKDPYDWLLVAQAKTEKMKFITADSKLKHYIEDCICPI